MKALRGAAEVESRVEREVVATEGAIMTITTTEEEVITTTATEVLTRMESGVDGTGRRGEAGVVTEEDIMMEGEVGGEEVEEGVVEEVGEGERVAEVGARTEDEDEVTIVEIWTFKMSEIKCLKSNFEAVVLFLFIQFNSDFWKDLLK